MTWVRAREQGRERSDRFAQISGADGPVRAPRHRGGPTAAVPKSAAMGLRPSVPGGPGLRACHMCHNCTRIHVKLTRFHAQLSVN
jgi:hypothetical protein